MKRCFVWERRSKVWGVLPVSIHLGGSVRLKLKSWQPFQLPATFKNIIKIVPYASIRQGEVNQIYFAAIDFRQQKGATFGFLVRSA